MEDSEPCMLTVQHLQKIFGLGASSYLLKYTLIHHFSSRVKAVSKFKNDALLPSCRIFVPMNYVDIWGGALVRPKNAFPPSYVIYRLLQTFLGVHLSRADFQYSQAWGGGGFAVDPNDDTNNQ